MREFRKNSSVVFTMSLNEMLMTYIKTISPKIPYETIISKTILCAYPDTDLLIPSRYTVPCPQIGDFKNVFHAFIQIFILADVTSLLLLNKNILNVVSE